MTQPPAQPPMRRRLVEHLAARVPRSVDGAPVLVGVDGVDGAGKTVLADELAAALAAADRTPVRVSVDDFHQPRALRHRRGTHSPEGFWLDSYDYAALRAAVLEPFAGAPGGLYRPAVHDLRTDQAVDVPPRRVPPDAVLVVDGIFLHRDELAGAWDLSVWLRVSFAATYRRMAARDGCPADPHDPRNRRYLEGQRLYLAACAPEARADVVVDNEDVDAPFVVRDVSARSSPTSGMST